VCDNSVRDAAVQLIFRLLEQYQEGMVDDAEFQGARNRALGAIREPFGSPATAAPVLARDYAVHGDAESSVKTIGRLKGTTRADAVTAARWLTEDRLTVVETIQAAPLALPGGQPKNLILKRQLNNGLRVALEAMPTAPLVTVRLSALGGLRGEPQDKEGISALAAAALFGGTSSTKAAKIRERLQGLGAEWKAFVEEETSGVELTLPAEGAPNAMGLLADLVSNPLVPDEQLAAIRAAAGSAIHDYPDHAARRWAAAPGSREMPKTPVLYYALRGGRPFFIPLDQMRNHYQTIAREDILLFLRTHFTPPNLVIAIAGNIDPDDILLAVENQFGRMTGGATTLPVVDTSWFQATTQSSVIVDPTLRNPQTIVIYGTAPRKHKDRAAIDLLLDLWARRVPEAWRAKRARAAGSPAPGFAASRFFGTDLGYAFLFSPTPSADPLLFDDVLGSPLFEWQNRPVDLKLLDDAKQVAIAEFVINSEDTRFAARLLTDDTFYGTDDLTTYRQRLEAITADDIRRVAQSYFGRKAAIVTLSPPPA
ncbi:MAG: insulinase family protein, partial [bacterium]